MNLFEWGAKWGVPPAAIHELRQNLGVEDGPVAEHAGTGRSEASISAAIRLEASRKGLRLFRNNVGALYSEEGQFIRFGLANDSAQLNKIIKSGDLIGIRPLVITQAHVGHVVGQFVSREVKAANWRYTGTDREQAQQRWALLISSLGGDAAFVNKEGSL